MTKPMKTLKMAVHEAGLLKAQTQSRLKAHRCKPLYMYDLYYKACVVSHRAGHIVYEPAGTP